MKYILIGLLTTTLLFPYNSKGEVLETIDAIVNGQLILSGEVDYEVQQLLREEKRANLSQRELTILRRNVLRNFIDEILVVQEVREKLSEEQREQIANQIEEETNKQLQQIRRQFTSPQDIRRLKQMYGLSWEDFRRMRARQIERDYLVNNVARSMAMAKNPIEPPTPQALEAFKRNHPDKEPGDKIEIAHILLRIPPNATSRQINSIEQKANEIATQARNGTNFSRLAQQFSDHDETKTTGGNLGAWDQDTIRSEFAFLFGQPEGYISDPVRTSTGFHIVKVVNILTWEDVYYETKHVQNVDEWLKNIRENAEIKIRYDDELEKELLENEGVE